MKINVEEYLLHKFVPNCNILLPYYVLFFVIVIFNFSYTNSYSVTYIVKHNMGVIIAIWVPIVLVSKLLRTFYGNFI